MAKNTHGNGSPLGRADVVNDDWELKDGSKINLRAKCLFLQVPDVSKIKKIKTHWALPS